MVKVFSVSSAPPVFVSQVGQWKQSLNSRKLTFQNVAEFSFHAAYKTRLGKFAAAFDHHRYILSPFSEHTNVLNNVQAFGANDFLVQSELAADNELNSHHSKLFPSKRV
eukprot:IDg16739t1